jgi:hypothetical protein
MMAAGLVLGIQLRSGSNPITASIQGWGPWSPAPSRKASKVHLMISTESGDRFYVTYFFPDSKKPFPMTSSWNLAANDSAAG